MHLGCAVNVADERGKKMSAIILDGKACAKHREAMVLDRTEAFLVRHGARPRLGIMTDGHDHASAVYVRNKLKAAERCGIEAEVIRLPENCTREAFEAILNDEEPRFDALILQLPLTNRSDEEVFISCLPEDKDVDCLHPNNIGMLHSSVCFMPPCTPKGIITLLKEYEIPLFGKHVVIVGRSNLVGRPLAELMLQENATVTVCHSKTENLADITRTADILVVAIGKAKYITADMVKPGAVVVDVGINRDENDKLCGDVDFEAVKDIAAWITPVPGGVGPMTVVSLMENVLMAALDRRICG